MKHLAAYMMLVKGGNAKPSSEDVTKVIESVGGEVDAEKLALLFSDLGEKDFMIDDLLAEGREKLKDVSVGGGGGGGAAPAAAAGDAPAAEAEKPKEEEVDAFEGGMDMFGGGGGDY